MNEGNIGASEKPGRMVPHNRQAHREKGLLAGQALIGRLGDGTVAWPTDLPVRLVVRGSTGFGQPDQLSGT